MFITNKLKIVTSDLFISLQLFYWSTTDLGLADMFHTLYLTFLLGNSALYLYGQKGDQQNKQFAVL